MKCKAPLTVANITTKETFFHTALGISPASMFPLLFLEVFWNTERLSLQHYQLGLPTLNGKQHINKAHAHSVYIEPSTLTSIAAPAPVVEEKHSECPVIQSSLWRASAERNCSTCSQIKEGLKRCGDKNHLSVSIQCRLKRDKSE